MDDSNAPTPIVPSSGFPEPLATPDFPEEIAQKYGKGNKGAIPFGDGRTFLPNKMMVPKLKRGVEFFGLTNDGRVLLRKKSSSPDAKHGYEYKFLPNESLTPASEDDLIEAGSALSSRGIIGKLMPISEFEPGAKDKNVRALKTLGEVLPLLASFIGGGAIEPYKAGAPMPGPAIGPLAPTLGRAITGNLARAAKIGGITGGVAAGEKTLEGLLPGEKVSPGAIAGAGVGWGVGAGAAELVPPVAKTIATGTKDLLSMLLPVTARSAQMGEIDSLLAKQLGMSGVSFFKPDIAGVPTMKKFAGAVAKTPYGELISKPARQIQYGQATDAVKRAIAPFEAEVPAKSADVIGKTMQAEIEAERIAQKDLYIAGMEGVGGSVDATNLIDAVEGIIEPGEEAASFFKRLSGPIRARYGKVARLIPKFQTAEELNAVIDKVNKQAFKNAGYPGGLDQIKYELRAKGFGGNRNPLIDKIVDEQADARLTSLGIVVKNPVTEDEAYEMWKAKAVEQLKSVDVKSLDEVRKLFSEEANRASEGNKYWAAIGAKNAIDEAIDNSAMEAARKHYSIAMAMADPKREPVLAKILNSNNPEDIASLFVAKNPTELAEIISFANAYNRPKVKIAARQAYVHNIAKDPRFEGHFGFGLMKDRMGLTDQSVIAILKDNFTDEVIPKYLRDLFVGDAEGELLLKNLAAIGELATRTVEMNPSGTAYSSEAIRELKELSTIPVAKSHVGAVMNLLSHVGGFLGISKFLFTQPGTEWLAKAMTSQPGPITKAVMPITKQMTLQNLKLLVAAALEYQAYVEGKPKAKKSSKFLLNDFKNKRPEVANAP